MPCDREGNLESQILAVYLRVVHEFGWVAVARPLTDQRMPHAHTDGQPENLLPPTPSIGCAKICGFI